MNAHREKVRTLAKATARGGTVISGAMLVCTAVLAVVGGPTASAATNGGAAQVITPTSAASGGGLPLNSGGSATEFSLRLPTGASCTGDSAKGGYRVQSYMVPSSVDPSSLTFGELGPIPGGFGSDPYRQPLFQTTSTGYVHAQTANADVDGGPGQVVSIPAFALGPPEVFDPGDIPAGVYNIGIACTKGEPSATQLDKYWNAVITVATSANDLPAGVTWTAQAVTTTTTTPGATTSTTKAGGSTTSTTASGGTTTTTAGGTTTSTTPGGTTSTTVSSGGPTGTSGVGGVGNLPLTGGSPMSTAVWAFLFFAFGRMAILLGRPTPVREAKR